MHKYEISLYWSNEDRVFVAEAPELPGCMAHRDDHETALANIKDAMQFWIDRARQLARPLPVAQRRAPFGRPSRPVRLDATPNGPVRNADANG